MSIFDLSEFKQYQAQWNKKIATVELRQAYYDGSVYKSDTWRGFGSMFPRLYRGIKPLYLPLSRAVDTDVGLVPGDWELTENAEPLQNSVDTIFRWSSWQTDGVLYIHNGASSGLSGLKILMNQDLGQASIAPIASNLFIMPSTEIALQIQMLIDESGDRFEFAQVYTPQLIRTYRNGVPNGFGGDPERPNPLGLVPFIEVPHIRTGNPLGTPTFDKVIPMLNNVNELASYLAAVIRKHTEPQWIGYGMEGADMQKSGDAMWFVEDENARIDAAVPKLDINGTLAFIQEIDSQVRRGLPELAFDEIQQGQIATQTVELQLMELITKIKRIRPNYDNGLRKALRMCGMAMAIMGQRDIAGDLLSKDLEFNSERDILPENEKSRLETEILRTQLDTMQGGMIAEGTA